LSTVSREAVDSLVVRLPNRRQILGLLALVAAFVLVRGPLHRVTFALPVSNDDAILLLMGRHVLSGEFATILWNQPYNGALDAYLLAPLLALFSHHAAHRLYELVCALLLVVLVGLLARRLAGRAAGWAAALLAACGTPYMALMTATGPPPNFLMPLVTGFPLLAALAALAGRAFGRWTLLGLGFACGLAVWNSSLAIPAFCGMALGLALAGLRPRALSVCLLAAGAALGVSPLVVARVIGASGAKVTTAASAVTAMRPMHEWSESARSLGHALAGLTGLQVPLVVDGKERETLPAAVVLLLASGLLIALVAGIRSRRTLPLLGWALTLAGAFWLSRRTGPDELRYLYGLHPPLLTLAGLGIARAWEWRRSAAVALGLAVLVPWAWGDRLLTERWRDPAYAEKVWEVPPLEPALDVLRVAGIRSAYASLQFAGRITLETKGDVIASQAWNERIPGDPLRFRDEVDLDPLPAWVLSERISKGMPRAAGFRELLRSSGGSWSERPAGDLVVFSAFRPPYDEARPVPARNLAAATIAGQDLGPAVLDRDPQTRWVATTGLGRGSGIVLRVSPPRRLSAVVLLVDLERSPLAVPWAASLGGAIVAQGPIRAGLQWLNGAPRAGKQALLVVPLGERVAGEVQLAFQGAGPPLVVGEVFAYGPDEALAVPSGREAAVQAFEAARAGRWGEAQRLYAEAIRGEPERASYHAAWARARWRAAGRRWLDVESLDDGGPELVGVR
jgi:hypothetical protein